MGEPCRKCRGWRPIAGDTWCIGCGAWETIGQELIGTWSGPVGLRSIANDLVLSCAREVRALRAVGAGIGRGSTGSSSAPLTSAPVQPLKEDEEKAEESAVGAAAKSKAPRPGEGESEYTYTDGESEEEREETQTEKKKEDLRPALPRVGRGSAERTSERQKDKEVKLEKKSDDSESERRRKGKRDRELEKESSRHSGEARDAVNRVREERNYNRRGGEFDNRDKDWKEKKHKHKKRKKGKRGGRKHARLHRLSTDPFLPHHRRLSAAVLEDRDRL